MLGFTIAYWVQAHALSFAARLFPTIVTVALVLMLAVVAIQAMRRSRPDGEVDDSMREPEIGTPLAPRREVVRRLSVVAVPGLLLLFWNGLGGAIFTWIAMLLMQLGLGERRPLRLLLLPTILAAALYLLFSTLLHARIPMGVLAPLLH